MSMNSGGVIRHTVAFGSAGAWRAGCLADPSVGLKQVGLASAGIQDDTYSVGSLRMFAEKRQALLAVVVIVGHECQPNKCQVWAPAWDSKETEALPQWAQEFFDDVPRASHGVIA